MYVKKPRDIGGVVKKLYENEGLKKEVVADFLNMTMDELESFESGYHVVNAFDLERLCALFSCKLCPDGIDMTDYKMPGTEKPLEKLKKSDLDMIASSNLPESELIYNPQF